VELSRPVSERELTRPSGSVKPSIHSRSATICPDRWPGASRRLCR